MPAAEAEAWLQAKVDRRQFLGGMALTGAIGVVPELGQAGIRGHQSKSKGFGNDSKVLIVGAGIAGLTAAYRLQQAGVPVDIIEANSRVGGRLVSLSRLPAYSGLVELGGEFIDSRHTTVRSLAAELGLEMADLRAADVGLEPEILYFQGQKVRHEQVAEAFIPLAQKIAMDLQQLGSRDITYENASPHAIQLDQLSLADYLAAADVSPLIEQLVRVAYITEFGRDAESQSCLNMLFLIGAEVGQWSTYGLSDERWHVIGGNDQIPKRLAGCLNSAIETETVLESIRMTPGGRYQVSLRQNATAQERIYDRVLLTVPFSVLRQINLAIEMPPLQRSAIEHLGYGTGTKLTFPLKERIWRTRYGSTISIYTDRAFQNTWESARYSPGTGGWVTDLRGGQAGLALGSGSTEKQAEGLLQDLDAIFPGIHQVERGSAVRAVWAREPYALGTYSCYLPGQWTKFRGVEGNRVGNLWFAGEHCSLSSQGFMNGACETAEAAARSILQDLGVRV
ncbi:MAG TPA: NAD(P)/FAD-dependent oxidoreductase [Trichocoleus sp.]